MTFRAVPRHRSAPASAFRLFFAVACSISSSAFAQAETSEPGSNPPSADAPPPDESESPPEMGAAEAPEDEESAGESKDGERSLEAETAETLQDGTGEVQGVPEAGRTAAAGPLSPEQLELQRRWALDPLGGSPGGPPTGKSPESPDQDEDADAKGTDKFPFEHFFDHIDLRGYTQLRYNHLGQTNPRLVNVQADKSWGGEGGGFFFRRARIILYGDLHPQVQIYFQPDFVSAPSSDTLNFVQLRDWYADLSDPSTEFRVRVGQSKVPFGFENMQSSSNRLPLDRSDALNSAVANERDIGLFFYYAPVEVRRRFKHLVSSGLKGSGDYGMAGIGVYNGQTANRPEMNENKHVVARVTYPFKFGEQFVEVGAAGYAGKYVIKKDPEIGGGTEFRDARAQATFVLYPQPFGLQVEYNVGIGPELDGREVLQADGSRVFTGEVREQRLHGGYALASLVVGDFIPYARGIYYEGGKKHETNAPSYTVRELEMGVEWHIIKALELVGAYTIADRTFSAPPYNLESGRLFRFQLQINY